jgi:hypothetical protein
MNWLAKRSSIKRCVRDLSQRLMREHGALASYAEAQVSGTIRDWRMRIRYPAYAYALFCTRDEFARLDPNIRLDRDYDDWRRDVGRQYPRLSNLDPREIAAFAREYWILAQSLSPMPFDKSFEPRRRKD